MQRRATSKRRAAEAEKELEIDMDNKEATPVDVESSLPPVLSKQPEQPGEQPEMPTQTGEINVRKERLEQPGEPSQTENTATTGDVKFQETLMRMMVAVSYTHLDVYKRQLKNCLNK